MCCSAITWFLEMVCVFTLLVLFEAQFPFLELIVFAGYGGAVSMYFGLFSGLQLLEVALSQMNIADNAFSHCFVNVRPQFGCRFRSRAVAGATCPKPQAPVML